MLWIVLLAIVAFVAWKLARSRSARTDLDRSSSSHSSRQDKVIGAITIRTFREPDRRSALAPRLTPTAEEPWRGRQGEHLQDGSRPHSAESWEAVYNRPVTDDLLFAIEYADKDGVLTSREIRPISIHLVQNEAFIYINAHCGLRNEVRNFHSERIQSTRNLKTNRAIGDLGGYLRSRY